MLKTTLRSCFRGLGFDVIRVEPTPKAKAQPNQMIDDGYSTNMEVVGHRFETIRGMTSRERGQVLYLLAYSQNLRGDVIEIGSWQGKSTCFLAQACKDSGNGVVRAVDHLKGNQHSISQYMVGKDDLSDLEAGLRGNVERMGLTDQFRFYNMPSAEAASQHAADFQGARLLFIDGDHSYPGVIADLDNFESFLQVGGLIAFDDYHSDGKGVVQGVRERIFESGRFDAPIQYRGLLVARKIR